MATINRFFDSESLDRYDDNTYFVNKNELKKVECLSLAREDC